MHGLGSGRLVALRRVARPAAGDPAASATASTPAARAASSVARTLIIASITGGKPASSGPCSSATSSSSIRAFRRAPAPPPAARRCWRRHRRERPAPSPTEFPCARPWAPPRTRHRLHRPPRAARRRRARGRPCAAADAEQRLGEGCAGRLGAVLERQVVARTGDGDKPGLRRLGDRARQRRDRVGVAAGAAEAPDKWLARPGPEVAGKGGDADIRRNRPQPCGEPRLRDAVEQRAAGRATAPSRRAQSPRRGPPRSPPLACCRHRDRWRRPGTARPIPGRGRTCRPVPAGPTARAAMPAR